MPRLDYAALSAAAPSPYLILDSELVIMEVNQAYLDATRRTRLGLLGKAPTPSTLTPTTTGTAPSASDSKPSPPTAGIATSSGYRCCSCRPA